MTLIYDKRIYTLGPRISQKKACPEKLPGAGDRDAFRSYLLVIHAIYGLE